MKNISKILKANPDLSKELAKLIKEELELAVDENQETELLIPDESTGDNDVEVRDDAPAEDIEVDNAEVAGEGHEVDEELTPEDPITPEELDEVIEEIPVEDLEEEVEGLEEVKKDDEEQIEELEEIIEEASQMKAALQKRIVFTESVINKVNARILVEAAKVLAGKKTLTENKKR